jgi:hypothetical protein
LPASVAAAVVADIKTQIAHSLVIPFWLPVRHPLRTGIFHIRHKPERVRGHSELNT